MGHENGNWVHFGPAGRKNCLLAIGLLYPFSRKPVSGINAGNATQAFLGRDLIIA